MFVVQPPLRRIADEVRHPVFAGVRPHYRPRYTSYPECRNSALSRLPTTSVLRWRIHADAYAGGRASGKGGALSANEGRPGISGSICPIAPGKVAASGMEARRAETGTGSVHDGPVRASADAQPFDLSHNHGA